MRDSERKNGKTPHLEGIYMINGVNGSTSLEKTEYVNKLYLAVKELATLAIADIQKTIAIRQSVGNYSCEQEARDLGMVDFFTGWPEAEARYWLYGVEKDEFLRSFVGRYPWFTNRKDGVLVGIFPVN